MELYVRFGDSVAPNMEAAFDSLRAAKLAKKLCIFAAN